MSHNPVNSLTYTILRVSSPGRNPPLHPFHFIHLLTYKIMAIQYKVIGRGEPGVAGGGQLQYYAAPKREREVTLRELVKEIQSRSSVTTADAYAVIENLLELIPKHMRNGRIVNLEQLGKFRVNLASKGHPSPDQVSVFSITGTKVIFWPSQEMKQNLAAIRFYKAPEKQKRQVKAKPAKGEAKLRAIG